MPKNDIKLQSQNGTHPVDENLRPILVGDKLTAIETAQYGSGARVNGNLEVTGDITGNVTDITFDDITFDDITCATITTTGTITSGGNIDAGSNSITANGGLIADNITIDGTSITLSTGNLALAVGDGDSLEIKENGSTMVKSTSSGRPPTLWWLLMTSLSPPPDSIQSGAMVP